MNTKDIEIELKKSNIFINIILVNLFIPLTFMIITQIFAQIFNPFFTKADNITILTRIAIGVNKPIIYVLFSIAEVGSCIIIYFLLKPLFDYISDGKNYNKARVATVKISWFLLILHTGSWLIVSTLFYAINKWSAPNGVPYIWSMGIQVYGGIYGALFSILVINNILIKAKKFLNMTDIKDKENDFFTKYKSVIILIASSTSFIVLLSYVTRFFLNNTIEDYVLKPISSMVITGFIIGLVTLLMNFFSWREDSKQLNFIREKLFELISGKGDLSKRVVLLNFDNMGGIAVLINLFIEKLRNTMIKIANTSKNVAASSDNLSNVLSTSVSATEEMIASIDQINVNVSRQQEVMKSAGDILKKMVDNLDHISEEIELQSSNVEETSTAINQMVANISSVTDTTSTANNLAEELVKLAEVSRSTVVEAINSIYEIEKSSLKVNEFVTVIKRISNQTNLLSMNAAIEAAHAGEAGSGFAVVAEEVRNLANESSVSAKEIASHIKEMSNVITRGVGFSEKAQGTLDKIIEDINTTTGMIYVISSAMNEQKIGADEILQSITALVSATGNIKDITTDQRSNNDNVKESINRILTTFEEIKYAIEEQSKGNMEIINSINNLQEISVKNQHVVESLQELLEDFKT